MRQQQFSVPVGETGTRFVRRYAPDGDEADRTLVIVHGVGEHSGRYEHFVRGAVERGWCVLAGDLQGHGQSDGVPTHLDDFAQYLADLDAIWTWFGLNPRRTALYGHSMGGLVCARFAESRPESIAALVLSSPLLGFAIRVPPLKKTFGRVCLTVAPRFRFRSKIPESFITRNTEALQIRASDPFSNRTVTAGWYFRVLDALCEAWQDAGRIEVPLLVMQGDADRVVSPDAPLGWITRVGSSDKSLRLLSGHLHELINEPGWQGTVAGVLDWLEERVASRRAAASADRSDGRHFDGGVLMPCSVN
jgi:lysophospholipase